MSESDPRGIGGFFDGRSHPVRNGTPARPGPFSTLDEARWSTGLPAASLDDEVDGLALQAALDGLPPRNGDTGAGGGEVLVPGDCLVSRPLRLWQTQSGLVGAGTPMIMAAPSGGFPLIVVAGQQRPPAPIGPPLVPGSGGSLTLTGDLGHWLDFGETIAPARAIGEGWPAFTAECFFRVNAEPQTPGRHLFSSYGSLVPGRESQSMGVWFEGADSTDPNAAEKIWIQGVVGGVTYQAYTPFGAFERGQVYHLALVYDGSAVSLYLGRPGEPGSRILTCQTTGLWQRRYYENFTVGARPGRWPNGSPSFEMPKGAIDGFRLISQALYSGDTYATPGEKPAVTDTSVLQFVCNFDRSEGILVGFDSFAGSGWLVCRRGGGGAGHGNVRVERLRLNAGTGTALYAVDCQQLRIADLLEVHGLLGLVIENNCYQAVVRDIKVSARLGGLRAVGNVSNGTFDGMDLAHADWGMAAAFVDAYDLGVSNLYAFGARGYVLVTGDDMTFTGGRWSLGNEASIAPDDIAVFGNCRNVSVAGFSSWFKDPVPPIRVYGGDRHTFYNPKIKASSPETGPPCVVECPGQQPARPVDVVGLSLSGCSPELADPPESAVERF